MRSISIFVLLFASIATAHTINQTVNTVFDLGTTAYKDPLLVSTAHGVGSKLNLAQMMHKHDTIGIDLVALCTNDLIAAGAQPIFFTCHRANGKLNADQDDAITKGILQVCTKSGCQLTEVNVLEPELYNNDEYNLTGFAVGIVERDKILAKKELIKQGDVIIGLPSSGIQVHGYDLLHKLIEDNNVDITVKPPFATYHQTFADALLEPTLCYANWVLPLCDNKSVKAVIPITRGGLIESLSRVLPDQMSAQLDMKLWYIPPLFRWLKYVTHLTDQQMLHTFNCGIGMALIADTNHAAHIIQKLSSQEMHAQVIGTIEPDYQGSKVSVSGAIPTHAMKVLVVGASAREHAIVWKLAQSPHVGLVLIAPGNGGTIKEKKVHNIPINPQHTNALITYAKQQEIDLIIVGPKELLVGGFADECRKKGLRCMGPSKTAALLIESTAHAQDFMTRHRIPSCKSSDNLDDQKISFMVITDGNNSIPLATCQNHNNLDLDTSSDSMGTICPAPSITPHLQEQIMQKIIQPTIQAMKAEGIPFIGLLQTDVVIKDGKPYLIKYHCHLGDPETQTMIMRLKSDFFLLCSATIDGHLNKLVVAWDERPALSVVATAGENPTNYKKGDVIVGIPETDYVDEKIFHASTTHDNGRLITNGSRVLCATALGDNLLQARNSAYNLIKNLYWPSIYYRTDIGYDALSR